MKNLKRERSDKLKLENWAANKIQKLYRSYATGPKIYTVYTRKARQMSLQIIRQDVSIFLDMKNDFYEIIAGTIATANGSSGIPRRRRSL